VARGQDLACFIRREWAANSAGGPQRDLAPHHLVLLTSERFILKPRDDEMRIKPKTKRMEWKRWFAWHPVIIDNVTIWFETIERKRDPDIFDWVYSYRLIEKKRDRKYLRLLRSFGGRWRSGDRKLP
jgi:hypothetical protein